MRRAWGRCPLFNRLRRIRAAHEVERIAKLACAVGHPDDRRNGQHDREENECSADRRIPSPAPQRLREGDQPCQGGKDPSVVARKYRGHKDDASGDEQLRARLQLGCLQSPSVLNDEQDCPDHLRQEQRFVHRCRLHVEQTGIQGEEQHGNQSAARLNPEARKAIDSGGSKNIGPHRGKRAR